MPTNDNLKDENVVITKRKAGSKEQASTSGFDAGELLNKVLNIITPPAGAAEVPVLPSDNSSVPSTQSVSSNKPSTNNIPTVEPVQIPVVPEGISQSYPVPTVNPNVDLAGGVSVDVYDTGASNQLQQPIATTPLIPTIPTADQINNDLMVEIPVEDSNDAPVTIDVTDTGSANTPVEEPQGVNRTPFIREATRYLLNNSNILSALGHGLGTYGAPTVGLGDIVVSATSGIPLDKMMENDRKTTAYVWGGLATDPVGTLKGFGRQAMDMATGIGAMALEAAKPWALRQREATEKALANREKRIASGLSPWDFYTKELDNNLNTFITSDAPYSPVNLENRIDNWNNVREAWDAGVQEAPEISEAIGRNVFDIVLSLVGNPTPKASKVTSSAAVKAAQDVSMAKVATNYNKAQKTIDELNRTIDKINEANKETNALYASDPSYIPRPQITLEDVLRASEEGLDLYDSRMVSAANQLEKATKQMLESIPDKYKPISENKRQVVQYVTRKRDKLFAEYDKYYDEVKAIEKELDTETRRVADEIGKRYGIKEPSKVTVELEDAGLPKVPEGVDAYAVVRTDKVDTVIPDWKKWYTEEELTKLNGKVPNYAQLANHLYSKQGLSYWQTLKNAGIDEILNADGSTYSRGGYRGYHDRNANSISFRGDSAGVIAHEIMHSLENAEKSAQGNRLFKEAFEYVSPTNKEQAFYDFTRYIDGVPVEDIDYLRPNYIAQSEFAEIANIIRSSRIPELVEQLKAIPDYDAILQGVYKQKKGLFRTTLHAFNKVYEYSPEIKAAAQQLRNEYGIKYKGKFTPQIVGKMLYEEIAKNYRNAGVMLDNAANAADATFKTEIVSGKLNGKPLVTPTTPIEDIAYLSKDDILNKSIKEYADSAIDTLPKNANPDDYVAIQKDTVKYITESRTPHEFVSGLLGDIYKIARSSLLGGGTYVGGNTITSIASTATAANLHYLDDVAAALKSRGNLSKDLGIYRYDRPAKYDTRFGEIAGAVNDILGASVIRRLDRAIQNSATEVAANTALREAGVPSSLRGGDWLTQNLTPEQLGKVISDARNYAVTDSRSILPKNLNKALGIAFPFIGYQNAALRSTATLLRNHPIATNLIWNWTLGKIGYDQEMQNRYRLGVKSDKSFVAYRANPNTGETMEVSIENVPMITNAKILATPVQVAEHLTKTGSLQGLNGNLALDPIFITEVNASLKGEDAYGNQLRTKNVVPAGNGVRYNTKTGAIIRGGTIGEVANTTLTGLVGGTRLINRTLLPTGAGIYNAITGDDMTYYLPYANMPIGQFARRSDVLKGTARNTTGDFTRPRTIQDVFMSLIGGYQRPLYTPRINPNRLTPNQLRQIMRNQMYYNNRIQRNNQRINP